MEEQKVIPQITPKEGEDDEIPAFLKGLFISDNSKSQSHFLISFKTERSYFVLDSESDLVHFFKKTNQTKPYQTLSLYSGIVMNDMNNEQKVVEKITGRAQ